MCSTCRIFCSRPLSNILHVMPTCERLCTHILQPTCIITRVIFVSTCSGRPCFGPRFSPALNLRSKTIFCVVRCFAFASIKCVNPAARPSKATIGELVVVPRLDCSIRVCLANPSPSILVRYSFKASVASAPSAKKNAVSCLLGTWFLN